LKPNVTAGELHGQVALITGVSRRAGLGAAIARALAGAGAKVFVSFLRSYDQAQSWGVQAGEPESLLEELSALSEVSGLEIDLSAPSAPGELMERAVLRFGRVDILVNNAAHWEPGGIEATDSFQLDRHYAVNTRAAVLLCAELVRHKRDGSPGRIVNITSGQGLGPMPGEIAYVVTKAALDALTLSLSAELASRGITVNAVDPGPTDTGWISEEQRRELVRTSATGRIATPEDTARAVLALVRADAASVTGQILRVQPSKVARP
jgi:3-oxoacyl-[acyl-carrier protein] reductase